MAVDRRRRSGLAAEELKVKKVVLQLGEVAVAIDGRSKEWRTIVSLCRDGLIL